MKKDNIKRRDFLKTAGTAAVVGTGALVFGCSPEQKGEAPAVQARKNYNWSMATTWAPHFPVLGEAADLLAKWVNVMSDGQMKITVYGAGELVPAMETFDAVSQGMVQMGHAASYYWAGKAPSVQFFAAVPFGMNAQQMNAWINRGGGQELWDEVYGNFNLVPMSVGNTGVQMGGWFNKEINSASDLRGLKMRIPGLGGKVLAKAGGSAILSPGGEIYTNLERGVIDATEWVGPYHDYLMGFYKVAKFYYYPGWHEPGTIQEMFVNKAAFEELPANLKEIIRTASYRSTMWMLSEFEAKNNEYLQKLINEHHVNLKKFPDDVLRVFKRYSQEVIEEIVEKDAVSKKVYDSFTSFKKTVTQWSEISEKAIFDLDKL